jgi:thiol-disulfide isomerase/thioredoxin
MRMSAGRAAGQRRRAPLLLLVALVAGAALFQYLGRGAGSDGPLRFVVQAEPRALPALRFVDGDGKAMDLSRQRGKVVLLNIWATWCAPCRREMPSLDRLQAALGSDRFEVVALSIDLGPGGLGAARAFYGELGLRHLRLYNDPEGQAGFALGVAGVPATFLVDADGREIGRLVGPAEWDGAEAQSLIRRHLEASTPP